MERKATTGRVVGVIMVGVAALAAATAARADVIYRFVPNEWPSPVIALTISDAAVTRGSFDVNADFGRIRGDVADFRSLRVDIDTSGTGNLAFHQFTDGTRRNDSDLGTFYNFKIDLTFDGGAVASSFLEEGGISSDIYGLTGIGQEATGTWLSDFTPCSRSPCAMSGTWTNPPVVASAVPEPPAFGVLGLGLLGLLAGRLYRARGGRVASDAP